MEQYNGQKFDWEGSIGEEFRVNDQSADLAQPALAVFEDGGFAVMYSAQVEPEDED